MNNLLIFLTLSIITLNQIAYASHRCPQGIGSREGDKPFFVYNSKLGRQLAFCGWSEQKPDGTLVASEYEVIDTASGDTLLRFGALEQTIIRTKGTRLAIVEVVNLPFAKNWKYLPVERYIYRPRETGRGLKFRQEYVFMPPNFDKEHIAAVLKAFQILKEKKHGNEEISGMLMIAALSGSDEAKIIFENLNDHFMLDGAVAEEYTAVMDIYREFIAHQHHNKLLKRDAGKDSRTP